MEMRIGKIEPMKVACIRHLGPYDTCCKAWERLFIWAGKRKFVGAETVSIGVSYDDPETTPPEKIRYDACITVGSNVESEGEIKVMEIGGGEYAKITHIGNYGDIKGTFRHLIKELIPRSGRKMRSAPCLEIYIDNPDEIPEEKCRTELCVPIE
jgi:AraC family transcriptional regulator